MYGKIFSTIYDGTLYGHWQALVTFQQMIVLCDADGTIDMTPQALAARTGIPLDVIAEGIKFLERPDPDSRSPDAEGCRIERLDSHRTWGWHLVNHTKYKFMADAETIRAQNRERQRIHRENKTQSCNGASRLVTVGNAGHAPSRHTDTDTNAVKSKAMSGKPDVIALNGYTAEAKDLLAFLNLKTGRAYQPVPANLKLIAARLKEGATVQEIKSVIAKKCREWSTDEKMAEYLRPATLFNATKFAQYRGELVDLEKADALPGL